MNKTENEINRELDIVRQQLAQAELYEFARVLRLVARRIELEKELEEVRKD